MIACLAWQSAPRHLKVRGRYLAWSDKARERNVHLLAYNTRFLILPWVQVEHLASHLLGRMAELVPQDWQRGTMSPCLPRSILTVGVRSEMVHREMGNQPGCKGGDILTFRFERLLKRDARLLEYSDARIETQLRAFLRRHFLQSASENLHAERIFVTDLLKGL